MRKMSETQRTAILLAFENRSDDKASIWTYARWTTVEVLRRNDWIALDGMPTIAGLIAAGVDMDAIHAEALAMDLAAAQAESDAIDAIEGDDPPMHFRADGSLHTGLTGVPQDRSDDGVPEVEQALRPHPFLPTMGSGAAYGPCQTRRCALPYADAIHHGGAAAPSPIVHAFSLDIQAAARAAACSDIGAMRGPVDAVTCPECLEILARRPQAIEQVEADVAALTDAMLQADLSTGRMDRRALPIVPPAPALYTPDNPGYGRTVHFEHEGRVVSGTVRGIVFGGGRHAVTVFSADLGHTHTIDHGITIEVADLLPAPATALTDEQRDGWCRELTAEARALAPELFDDTPAPTLADDVAALRANLNAMLRGALRDVVTDRLTNPSNETRTHYRNALGILDQIAGAVPQRATDRRGDSLRMHMPCRQIVAESRSACRSCDEVGPWRALYTLGGAA